MPQPARTRRLTPTRVVGLVHPGVRAVAATVAGMQAEWERENAAAAGAPGPLWLALGDSSVVGVGASSAAATAVAIVHRRLCAHDGRPWRVINLGRYGARAGQVLHTQLPRLAEWGRPELVTVGVGANDVAWSFDRRGLRRDLARLLDAVPPGAVIGTVPAGWWGNGLALNDWLRTETAARGLRLAEVGVFPDPGAMVAADGFHPNDAGYRHIAAGVLAALGLPATGLDG